MAASVTKILATGAVLFAGLLAGVTLNRALVQLPAWQRIGVLAWADFSRAENVGIGAILYPALGLAALLSTIGTALVYKLGRTKRFTTSIPIYTAAGVAITWALVTRVVLVPELFALNKIEDNALKLREIFVTVLLGSAVNDVLHVVGFALSLWALVALCSIPEVNPGAE
jgi:hypothetical protein